MNQELSKLITATSVNRVRVVAIVAVDAQSGIGIGNALPKFPKVDLKWFKHNTVGKVCIVGRKTYESLPPLKDRHFFVITKDPVAYSDNNDLPSNVSVVSSLESAVKYGKMHAWENGQTEIMLIGGKTIYDAALEENHLDELLVTYVMQSYDCNINIQTMLAIVNRTWTSRNIYNGIHEDQHINICHYVNPRSLPRL